MRLILNFIRDDRGATAIEYGLIAAAISLVVIAAATTTGKELWTTLNGVATGIAQH